MKKNQNFLTDELEQMRLTVVELELKARYWKAQADIRQETLRYDSLEDAYNEYIVKRQKSVEELQNLMKEQMNVESENVVTDNG